MVGRVGEERFCLGGVVGGAILGRLGFPLAKERIAKHFGEQILNDRRPKKVWTLSDHGRRSKPTIGRTFNREQMGRRVVLLNKRLGSRDCIVKRILLFRQHAIPVPRFNKLSPAAQCRNGKDVPGLEPREESFAVQRKHRRIEPTVDQKACRCIP